MNAIAERILELLKNDYDVDTTGYDETTTFESMNFDSLDVAEMVMTLEDEYKVSIEMSSELKTVGDLAKHIESKQAK